MRKIIKVLKKKELYFVIIVYPLLAYCAGFIQNIFYKYANANLYYGMFAALISIIIVLLTAFEIFKRIQGYELQGDKLKMRQREGLNVEDFKQQS